MIEASAQKSVSIPTGLDDQTALDLQTGTAESRLDPISGEWTIFAPYRDQRPDEFRVTRNATGNKLDCPFCKGHESSTPPAVWVRSLDDDDSSINDPSDPNEVAEEDWSVRVVPNKYPVVADVPHSADADSIPAETSHKTETRSRAKPSLFESRAVSGGHEVIIESAKHVQSLTELNFAEVAMVFEAYRERIQYWQSVPDVRFISIFKNVGGDAGASIAHTHSQLIATNIMPRHVTKIVDRMRHHQASTGCCLQCDLIRGELKEKCRVISQTESLIAYCPHASRLPMLVRITTKDHRDRFDQLDPQTIDDVSRMVVRVIGWLEKMHPGASYNYFLQTRPPSATEAVDAYHWSLEIFPRLTRIAGFEWSTRCMINPVLPELAAAQYRACAADEDPRSVR